MKNLILAIAVGMASTVAMADQSTDSINGPVTCQGKGFSVTISANRKTMTIRKDGAKSEIYRDLQQMAGDTETDYTPKGAEAPLLSFNDQGDFLQFNSKQNGVSISCPQVKDN